MVYGLGPGNLFPTKKLVCCVMYWILPNSGGTIVVLVSSLDIPHRHIFLGLTDVGLHCIPAETKSNDSIPSDNIVPTHYRVKKIWI